MTPAVDAVVMDPTPHNPRTLVVTVWREPHPVPLRARLRSTDRSTGAERSLTVTELDVLVGHVLTWLADATEAVEWGNPTN